jgi:hypothetical protein
MEIYILRDGSQTGPFSEQTIQRLLAEDSVAPTDLAWQPGAPQWIPLQEVLQARVEPEPTAPSPATPTAPEPSPVAAAKNSEPEAKPAAEKPAEPKASDEPEKAISAEKPPAGATAPEPATAKQRAFLGYMGITVAADVGKDQAALLVSEIMESPKDPSKLARWNEDRFRLHPELFAAEIQAKKENRAGRFFELAQTEGAKCFQDLAKAHCQVLVGYLDVKFPNWDARESDATWHYFFPAIAEKFPDLVTKEWRGKLRYPSGPKVALELKNRSGMHAPKQTSASPLWGLLQGLGIGAIALAVVVGGIRLMRFLPKTTEAKAAPVSSPSIVPSTTAPVAPASPSIPEAAGVQPAAPAAVSENPLEAPSTAPAAPSSPAAPTLADGAVPPAPAPTVQAPASGQPAAPAPAPPTNPNASAMSIPPAPDIVAGAPPASGEAPKPAATSSGSSLDALFSSPGTPSATPPATAAATPPPTAPPATASTAPAAAGKKSNVTLTKAIEVPVPFGKTQLPAGTQLKFIAVEGAFVKVDYLNMVVSVPVNATDLNADTP